MKNYIVYLNILIISLMFVNVNTYSQETELFTDTRDGQSYKIGKIGKQIWFLENLSYIPKGIKFNYKSLKEPCYYIHSNNGIIVTESKAEGFYAQYGVLYNWPAAKIACPEGWHLPSDEEWQELTNFLGAEASIKMRSTSGWSKYSNGTNSSGFNAIPGGKSYTDGGSNLYGHATSFWSLSYYPMKYLAYVRTLKYNKVDVLRETNKLDAANSVRCIKDGLIARFNVSPKTGTTSTVFNFDATQSGYSDDPSSKLKYYWDWENDGTFDKVLANKIEKHQFPRAGSYKVMLYVINENKLDDIEIKTIVVSPILNKNKGTFIDARDDHKYGFVKIGSQVWMSENLAFLPKVKYRTGSKYETSYYVYGYKGSNVLEAKAQIEYAKYGVLYDWNAAKTACPKGWHLPSDEEWQTLEVFLGMDKDIANSFGSRTDGAIGERLKSCSGWYNDGNGDNSVGLNILPAGFVAENGFFNSRGSEACFWASSPIKEAVSLSSATKVGFRYFTNKSNYVGRSIGNVINGYCVRCLKD
jgi:uncharacterized protein (TIGR02145 family)